MEKIDTADNEKLELFDKSEHDVYVDRHNDKNEDNQKPSARRGKYKQQQQHDQDVSSKANVRKLTNSDGLQEPFVLVAEDAHANSCTTDSSKTISSPKRNFSIQLNKKYPSHWNTDGKQVIAITLHPTSDEYEHVQEIFQNGFDNVNIVQVCKLCIK